MGWREDKARAERHNPQIKSILGRLLIGEAPEQIDMHEATDLIVLRMDPVRIACRIRGWKFYERFGDGFTIRSYRPSGAQTELAKISGGFCDLYFYGFEDTEQERVGAWVVLDLDVFRDAYKAYMAGGRPMVVDRRDNTDGSSSFVGFRLSEFPTELVKARHKPSDGRLLRVTGTTAPESRHGVGVAPGAEFTGPQATTAIVPGARVLYEGREVYVLAAKDGLAEVQAPLRRKEFARVCDLQPVGR